MPFLQTAGPVTIFASSAGSTSSVGSWYQVHPTLGRLGIQVIGVASSAGATMGTTVFIDVSNSTAYASSSHALTFGLTNSTTDFVSDFAGLPTTFERAWQFIRANMNSLTTSTAGAAGSPSVSVIVNAGYVASL